MKREPFIPVREITVACPNAQYWNDMASDLKRRYFLSHWTEGRLRRHVEMLKAYGFNSIQFSGAGQLYMNAGTEAREHRERMLLLCRTARERGLSVTQFVWGNCVCEGGEYRQDLDWRKRQDRARLEADYRETRARACAPPGKEAAPSVETAPVRERMTRLCE